jgi:hypothetical protein
MAQETSVEWFVARINKTSYDKIPELIEQAKQMNKEEIRDAYNDGHTDAMEEKPGLTSGTIYYNEKYGKDN